MKRNELEHVLRGSIGEKSPFHESFGYYAHGVGPETAILPSRWRERAVTIQTLSTGNVIGICPDPADIAISKLAAWRDKDQVFVRVLLQRAIVNVDEIRGRLGELNEEIAARIKSRLLGIS